MSGTKVSKNTVYCVSEGALEAARLSVENLQWAEANGFDGQRGKILALPNSKGEVDGYLFGLGKVQNRNPLIYGLAASGLPKGQYSLAGDVHDGELAALGFGLGAYSFDKYKKGSGVVTLAEKPSQQTQNLVEAAFIARDLINTPSNDLGPDGFSAYVKIFAAEHDMDCVEVVGDELLAQNFPMVHAVGRASVEAPRLMDLTWGDDADPKLTLVGKGVTFDTGGLNIKPGNSMALMKKDMGGAANILGLAHAVIKGGLKVRLRVILPIVENAISGSAFRPGDVLQSRKGLTVEIGNTDAEGRLILADALALADEEKPDLIIDMATLTGAARVALGPDLPPLYARDEAFAAQLVGFGLAYGDPLWPMPLWPDYEPWLNSKIADINHITAGGFAGSVTAALFLSRFVEPETNWVHMDIFGWSPEAKPGRSFGGTDQGIRAAYFALKARYGV